MTSRLAQNSVVINGSSSGSATIAPPAAAGTPTLTLPTSSGTLALTSQLNSGTVTSVATGNGLSGGTITTTGTLTVACPTYQSVGSYCFAGGTTWYGYAAGSNYSGLTEYGFGRYGSTSGCGGITYLDMAGASTSLPGTWKIMQIPSFSTPGTTYAGASLVCRVA